MSETVGVSMVRFDLAGNSSPSKIANRSAMRRRYCFATALLLALCGPARGEATRQVWLVGNGFHSAIAIRTNDLPGGREMSGDPRADELLIGWGDADFFRRKINPWTVLAAICWPTPSILHVVPVRGSVAARFPRSDVIELTLPRSRHRALCAELDAAFARDARGRRIFVQRGYFAASRFYAGRESFYFPKMCNLWVAQKLQHAGVPVFSPTAFFAGELTRQAGKTGVRLQSRRRPVDAF